MKFVAKKLGDGGKWCEGGRVIDVPMKTAVACDFQQPQPAKFGLLPIEIRLG